MALDGLYLIPDVSPYTSTTLTTGLAALVNSVNCTAADANFWYGPYAYGVDLGEVDSLDGLDVYCTHAGGDVSTWYSTSYDSVAVYKSDDNATWTLVEQFDGPPISYHISNCIGFSLTFTTSQSARYFKVVCLEISRTLAVGSGASVQVSEIIPTYTPATATLSGTVKDGSGNPLERTVYAYKASDGTFVDSTISDVSDGTFSLSVPPGEYMVVAKGGTGENANIFGGVTAVE